MPVTKNILAPGLARVKNNISTLIISNAGGVTLGADQSTVIITGSGTTVTLPAAPRDGVILYIRNDAGATTNTINGGVNTIDGGGAYALSASGQSVILQYQAASQNWYSLATANTTTTGAFTATVTGTVGPVTHTYTYVKYQSGFVSIDLPQSSGAADGTLACTITGIPAIIRPSSGARQMQVTVLNGSIQFPGIAQLTSAGVINLFFFTTLGTNPGSVFSATGNNGLLRCSFNYLM